MSRTRVLVEVAILVALAFILEFAFSFLPKMPQGGRIGVSMLPIVVIAWRHGVVQGIVGGVVFSILNLMLDGFVLYHWASLFLDYVIAFGVIGLAGFSRPLLGNTPLAFGVAIVIAFVGRFISHVLSGAVLFAEYAPAGQNPWAYSIIYNTTYLLPALILTLLVGIGVYFPLKTLESDLN